MGVVFSGLGFEEGSSIWDVVFLLRELERCSAKPMPLVPLESVERRIPGPRRKAAPVRDFVDEARKVFRGEVFRIGEVDARKLDALIIPGGLGCVKVLSSILRDGTEAQVLAELRDLVAGLFVREKPLGAMGYGAVLLAFILRAKVKPIITVGDDASMVEFVRSFGADVVKVQPTEVVVDEANRILTVQGISPRASLYRASLGIEAFVKELLQCEVERTIIDARR